MSPKRTSICSPAGAVGRWPFFLAGLTLMSIKYCVDRLLAEGVLNGSWSMLHYWPAEQIGLLLTGDESDVRFFAIMLAAAAPFMWLGTTLTLKRLRSVGWPLILVLIFFVPMANLILFALLSLLPAGAIGAASPAREHASRSIYFGRILPASAVGSSISAMMVSLLMGIPLTFLSVGLLKVYGVGLFVGLPFSIGVLSAVIHGYHQVRSPAGSILVGIASVALIGGGLLALGVEGAGCLIMAFPIWIFAALIGAGTGYVIQRHARDERELALVVITVVLTVPVLLGAEYAGLPPSPVFAVRTCVDVDARTARVWDHVISFQELSPPREWIFEIGVAYPTSAEIFGRGVGAERHCVFSTGRFVEPIEVWNEPHLLKFSVTSNPASMREWTPYEEIHPAHLEGFLVSRAGQFRLTPAGNRGTRLEGTTWYSHGMWPACYWRLWSDYAIHRIHLRVLNHVKQLAEAGERHEAASERGAHHARSVPGL